MTFTVDATREKPLPTFVARHGESYRAVAPKRPAAALDVAKRTECDRW